jgi:hypothetical protein
MKIEYSTVEVRKYEGKAKNNSRENRSPKEETKNRESTGLPD